MEQADGLKEDQTVNLSVRAHYQDGTQAVLPADKASFSTSGEGEVAVRKGMLELHKPGALILKAEYEVLQVKSISLYKQILRRRLRNHPSCKCSDRFTSRTYSPVNSNC